MILTGSPVVVLEWRAEFYEAETAPPSAADAVQAGAILIRDREDDLTVLVVVPADVLPSEAEIDRLSAVVWSRVQGWLDNLVPNLAARGVVRFGTVRAEVLDEMQGLDHALLLLPDGGSLADDPELVLNALHIPVWVRPVARDLPLLFLPCPLAPNLTSALRTAVDVARTLSGRLLLGVVVEPGTSEAGREVAQGDLARTLGQFDYRTIPGGVKIEVVCGAATELLPQLRQTEPIDVVLWPRAAGPVPRSEGGDLSFWIAGASSAGE